MTLSDYLAIFWRRKWILILAVLATVSMAVVRTMTLTPVYSATTTLRINTPNVGSIDVFRTDLFYTDRLMETYAIIATSGPVVEDLIAQLSLDKWPKISVEIVPDTEIMRVTIRDTDPDLAKETADALADILVVRIEESFKQQGQTVTEILEERLAELEGELQQEQTEYDQMVQELSPDDERLITKARTIAEKEQSYFTWLDQYERARANEAVRTNSIYVVEYAAVPTDPSSPNTFLNLALGFGIGAAAGLALSFLFESLDNTLYTSKQIHRVTADVTTLGDIPMASNRHNLFLPTSKSRHMIEAFRSLRTNIFLMAEHKLKTLVVASAATGEGKSTVVANLGIATAQSGRNVVIVDCDLRQPSLHKIFEIGNDIGLTELLRGETNLASVIQPSGCQDLYIVPSGMLPSDPLELLSSKAMKQLFVDLTAQFDMVLFDVAGLVGLTDATVLAQNVDGVLLVVRRGRAKQDEVREAYNKLLNVEANIIGIAVNCSEQIKS